MWDEVFAAANRRVLSRDHLLAAGATVRMLTVAVRTGHLIRARRDHYLLPSAPTQLVHAVRIGGRMGCLSALAEMGVFVESVPFAHVHLETSMSRLRSPRSRFRSLTDVNREGYVLHWTPLQRPRRANDWRVGVEDALSQSLLCQSDLFALATVESALHRGLIDHAAALGVIDDGPESALWLKPHVDGRAEAGQETVLRMLAVLEGYDVDIQVYLPGVGRVDSIVAGRLVLEADSRLAHDGWEHHVEDRRRDLALAELGLMSLRPAYQHTMHNPLLVRAAIRGLLG